MDMEKLLGFDFKCPRCKKELEFFSEMETTTDMDGNYFEIFSFHCMCGIIIRLDIMKKREMIPIEKCKDLRKKSWWDRFGSK